MSKPETFLHQVYLYFIERDWDHFEQCLNSEFSYCCDGAVVLSRDGLMKLLRSDSWQGQSYEIYDLHIDESLDHSLICLSYGVKFSGQKAGQDFPVEARETMVLKAGTQSFGIVKWHVSNR